MDRFTFSAPELPDWPTVKTVLGLVFALAWVWFVLVPHVRASGDW